MFGVFVKLPKMRKIIIVFNIQFLHRANYVEVIVIVYEQLTCVDGQQIYSELSCTVPSLG